MDYNRNDILLQEVKTKANIKLNINDSQERLYLKSFFKSDSEIHCSKFDKEDNYLAFGCSNGYVYVYDLSKSDKTAIHAYNSTQSNIKLPCTALRWLYNDKSSKLKQILISSNSDGTITFKNVKSDQILMQLKEEEENEVYAIDITKTQLASCGKDCKVRIYDLETMKIDMILQGIQWAQPGHNNRLFSVKFEQTDKNTILSGGWDQNVNIWDLRTQKSVGCILGPKIAGDCIDIKDNVVLTGSNRMNEQLQLWDIGTQKMIENVRWDESTESAGAYVYGAQFGRGKQNCLGGVAHGTNEFRLFDQTKSGCYKSTISVTGLTKGMYTLDFANTSNRCAVGGGDGVGLLFALLPYKEQ